MGIRGFASGGLDEGVEGVDAWPGGGGGIAEDRGEVFRAGHGPHAAGDLDTEFRHTDRLLRPIVIERHGRVGHEARAIA